MTRVIQYQIRSLLQQPNPENTTFMHPKHEFQNSNQRTKPTVAMLLSGGVDSSVALHLLLRQNYNVTAFYLKIWLEDELAHLGTCPWEDDFNTCKLVCQHASQTYGCEVPLESISLQKEYKERVISYTIHEAKRGRTPNPDVMCNR
jgi:tRNA-specific 2-thiouridylase